MRLWPLSFFHVKNGLFYEEVIFMTYRQIEASREARLWIAQVIIPVVTAAGVAMSIPEVRQKVAEKANNIKTSIKNKFKKD